VKHVLEAHGERLRVESRPGQGSAFSFGLPLAAEEPAALSLSGGGPPPGEGSAGKKG
jgi:hypothetical protein